MKRIILVYHIIFFTASATFSQSYKINKLENSLKNTEGIKEIFILNDLSEAYLDYNTRKSIKFAKDALKKLENFQTEKNIKAGLYNTIGTAYFYEKKYEKSLINFEEELEIIEQTDLVKNTIIAYYNIALSYQKSKEFYKANENFENALELAKFHEFNNLILYNHRALFELYSEWEKPNEAIEHIKYYFEIKNNELKSKQITVLRNNYRKNITPKLDKQNVQKETNLTEKLSTILLFVSVCLLLFFMIWVLFLYRRKRKTRKLINKHEAEIIQKSQLLEAKNTEIITSINYAKRVQNSILVPEYEIKKHLPDFFIYHQSKDIVSGDFYWFSKVGDDIVLATIDCAGHGIPVAFMSMIGNTLLNEIVNEKSITKPDIILRHLHLGIVSALQQTGSDDSDDAGMDMSLCTINTRLKRFQYAGAKNHLYVIQGDKLKILKANFHSVGGRPARSDIVVNFTSYDFMYDINTIIYMTSDGYMDQFGGKKYKKFNAKRFKQLLIKNHKLPMQKQKQTIQKTFEDWKGDSEQVDDVLVLGVKLY